MNYFGALATLGVVVLAVVVGTVMLITGYMPANGYGHNAVHAGRFGLVFGTSVGALVGVCLHLPRKNARPPRRKNSSPVGFRADD